MNSTISRDELAQLTVRRYEGPVCVVATPDDLDRVRHELRRERVVGLDVETRPSFRKGEVHRPSLVQVAASHGVTLFPLRRLDCAGVLTELFENASLAKAGIGLGQDFTKLRMIFPFQEQNVVDLSMVAKRHGVTQPSVRNLAGLFLGFRITKGQSTSNWGRATLTEKQIAYAATDAWVCRELYRCFEKQGFLDVNSAPDFENLRRG